MQSRLLHLANYLCKIGQKGFADEVCFLIKIAQSAALKTALEDYFKEQNLVLKSNNWADMTTSFEAVVKAAGAVVAPKFRKDNVLIDMTVPQNWDSFKSSINSTKASAVQFVQSNDPKNKRTYKSPPKTPTATKTEGTTVAPILGGKGAQQPQRPAAPTGTVGYKITDQSAALARGQRGTSTGALHGVG